MSGMPLYTQVVKALDEVNAPYMIVGAFAGSAFGLDRVTYDVDILVDLADLQIEALAARFPPPRYYADPEMMRDAMQRGLLFNIIDTTRGSKADLVPLTREPNYEIAFARRIRRTFKDEDGQFFEAWCAQPTDIIIGKLKAWAEGRSNKHPSDIFQILLFAFKGFSDQPIDVDAVSANAARLGEDTLTLWLELLARADQEAQSAN